MTAYMEQMISKTLDAMKSMVEKLLGIAPPIRKSDSDSFQAVSRLKRFGPFWAGFKLKRFYDLSKQRFRNDVDSEVSLNFLV